MCVCVCVCVRLPGERGYRVRVLKVVIDLPGTFRDSAPLIAAGKGWTWHLDVDVIRSFFICVFGCPILLYIFRPWLSSIICLQSLDLGKARRHNLVAISLCAGRLGTICSMRRLPGSELDLATSDGTSLLDLDIDCK